MTWTSKAKDLGVAKAVPHPNADPAVVGRAPAVTTINFPPLRLFGAAARCSHLQTINPSIVTPESTMMAALLEQHVDNVKNDFAIEPSADGFKDFVKSYFAGTVAAGLSYLTMIDDGYLWSDHFENLGGGSNSTLKTPDFVFAGVGTGVALVESKGSRSAKPSKFDATVRDGYTDQVEPHLGHAVGSITATHGYCIGAYLKSTSKAELRIHHTAVPAAGVGGSSTGDPTSIAAVQRGNYATAFSLAHSANAGRSIRTGESDQQIPFLRFRWRGEQWLSSLLPDGNARLRSHLYRYDDPRGLVLYREPLGNFTFAIQQDIAIAALNGFVGQGRYDAREGSPLDLPIRRFGGDPETATGEIVDGAIFPDGLAVITSSAKFDEVEFMVWSRELGGLILR